MNVRQATRADLKTIAAIHQESIRELCKDHYSPQQIVDWTAALSGAAYSELLHSRTLLVLEDAAQLLGFSVLDADAARINATYVSPGAARRGGGRSPMEAIEVAARAGGCTQLRLNATLNAVPFYERLGYTSNGTSSNRLPSGIELPCIVMSKPLV